MNIKKNNPKVFRFGLIPFLTPAPFILRLAPPAKVVNSSRLYNCLELRASICYTRICSQSPFPASFTIVFSLQLRELHTKIEIYRVFRNYRIYSRRENSQKHGSNSSEGTQSMFAVVLEESSCLKNVQRSIIIEDYCTWL